MNELLIETDLKIFKIGDVVVIKPDCLHYNLYYIGINMIVIGTENEDSDPHRIIIYEDMVLVNWETQEYDPDGNQKYALINKEELIKYNEPVIN